MPSPFPAGEGVTNLIPGLLPEREVEYLLDGKVCLVRQSDREVVLTRILRGKIEELNPGLPDAAYEDAVRQIVTVSASQTMAATNREKYEVLCRFYDATRRQKGASNLTCVFVCFSIK